MIIFGIDVPLVEIIFMLGFVSMILMVESIIIIFLLVKQQNETKKQAELVKQLSQILLRMKKIK